jgi:hypothetical protein
MLTSLFSNHPESVRLIWLCEDSLGIMLGELLGQICDEHYHTYDGMDCFLILKARCALQQAVAIIAPWRP